MKLLVKYLTILIFVLGILYIPLTKSTQAESLCPSTMNPDSVECLDYLRDKLADTNKEQSNLEKKLKDEDYQQLTLNEKIKYISGQISATETNINALELEIAAQDVEIKLLAKEIQTKEDSLSLVKQEADLLEDTVNKRITESYKYSFVGPLELFLDSKNIDTILRKTKYILETRQQDKSSLEEYNKKIEEIREEEMVLANSKADLQSKRNAVEEEKSTLVEERNNLSSQKGEKDRLLAESLQRERSMLATLEANRTKQAQLDEAIMSYIQAHGDQMADYGWVSAGTWIGRMGGLANGCSTGPHLHFSIDRIGTSYWNGYGELDPWSGYLKKGPGYHWISASGWKYYYITGGSMVLPLSGTVILTQDHHTAVRKAIDIYSLNGYGAPVYAATEGRLWKGTDRCGDTYAVVENTKTGIRTAYFHLQ